MMNGMVITRRNNPRKFLRSTPALARIVVDGVPDTLQLCPCTIRFDAQYRRGLIVFESLEDNLTTLAAINRGIVFGA